MMDDRYLAQTMMDQVGPEGQRKLARASAVVVGAGGLGSPALTYLAAAGVGRVGLIDADTVSRGNLNRQFLYGESDIGRLKAHAAREKLAEMNSGIEIAAREERLSDGNAKALLSGFDIVLGAVDSVETRLAICRAAAALGLPYIDGAVNGFCGQVMFSRPPGTPCLNCVFPGGGAKKKPAGVLGTTTGVVGTLEANLALLWLLDGRDPLESKLLLYDGFRMSFDFVEVRRDRHCPVCGGGTV